MKSAEWKNAVKTYPNVGKLAEAIAAGEIPTKLLSPGGAAVALGISRQAVMRRLERGTLRFWVSREGVILIDVMDVRAARREKRAMEKLDAVREQRRYGAGTM